jgi:hypothetical protein
MPRLSVRLYEKFKDRAASIESTRNKMEGLLIAGAVNLKDIENLFAGLYMELFTEFESLLEELFFGLYNGTYISRHYSIIRKSRIAPVAEIQPIVYGGKSYVRWLPYKENTLKRAKLFFDLGEPFQQLSNIEVRSISNYHIIRNAIAHKSSNSLNQFNNFISGLPLLPREKTPTGYLRSIPGSAGQNQFQIAIVELKMIVNKLCK